MKIGRLMPVPTAAAAAVRDKLQNLLDHLPWDCDLGHLEHDVAAVAHHLRANLDQLVLQGRQRPPASPACAGSCRGCKPAHEAANAPRWRRTFGTTVAST